ncbi:MAG: glycosyltransferase [Collinsella sp.]
MRYELPEPVPLVSVIIPSRDHADVLRACVGSLFKRSTYRAFEVIVVENHSVEPETRDLYGELSEAYGPAFRVLDISDAVEGFNYSRLINLGAAAAAGEYLLLLNNDTEVRSPDFMAEMLGYLQRPEVGVVGAKLYFRDGLTQHAGMLVGPHGTVCHPNQDFEPAREGYLSRAVRPGTSRRSPVRARWCERACSTRSAATMRHLPSVSTMWISASAYARPGRLVTFTPYAELFHYEFVSRGRRRRTPSSSSAGSASRRCSRPAGPSPSSRGTRIPIPTSIPTASITGCRGSPSIARGRSCL